MMDILHLDRSDIENMDIFEKRKARNYCWIRFNLQRTSFSNAQDKDSKNATAQTYANPRFQEWKQIEERLKEGKPTEMDKKRIIQNHMREVNKE